jgi:hypothetical protein
LKKAKSLLALTYTPKWFSECILQRGAKIETTFKDSPRVWPAFGNLGGAMEYLLCKGTAHLKHTERLLAPNAGQTDYFVQRSVQAQELFLTPTGRLRHAFLSIIREVVVTEREKESPYGGIIFDSLRGIMVATSMISAEHIYGSVSISIRKPLGRTRLGLMEFCGALWQDKQLPRNAILGPFERRRVVFSEKRWLPIILKLKAGREAIDQRCKNEFQRILRLSWSELCDMSAQFDQLCKKRRAETIDLPLCPYDLARIEEEIRIRQGIPARPNDSSGSSAKYIFGGNWDPCLRHK